MKSLHRFCSLVAGIIFMAFTSSVLAVSFSSDDFDDNFKSPIWGSDQILEGANVFLTEINQHLEFTGSSSSTNYSTIIRPWTAGSGSCTQDWEIAADINLGAVTLSQDDTRVRIFLVVADAANSTNNYLTFGFNLERTAGVTELSYEIDATMGRSWSRNYIPTLNQSDRVSIVYNSSAKKLGVYCGSGAMRADDLLVNDSRLISEWNMTADSSFVFALGGSISGCTNNGHEVWADNFSFTTNSNTNIYSGTYSGPYSGDDTGTWQVDVDNSGNILGKAQNGQFWYAVYGKVQADGTMGFVAADNVADFSGKVNDSGAVSGTWTSPYVGSGVFSGQRESNSSTKVIGLSGNLNFGGVVTGQTSTAILTITNSGNTVLTVTNITYPSCFSGVWSGTVAAGSATNVTVTFAPVAVTNYSGTVTVNSDKTDGTDTISASGSGTAVQPNNIILSANGGILESFTTQYNNDYAATKLTDGEVGTGTHNWGSDFNPGPQTFEYSFVDGKSAKLTSLTLINATRAYNAKGFELWISANGSNAWTKVAEGTLADNAQPQAFELSGQLAKRARLVITSGYSTAGWELAEFELYGYYYTIDGDGNGLPDWWEQQFFGSAGVNPATVCSNGFNTIHEAYLAGLDPNDKNARFGILEHKPGLNGTLRWTAVSGRVYSVYWSTNLLNGFQPLQTNYTGGSITDSLHNATGKCFYKINVQLAQ